MLLLLLVNSSKVKILFLLLFKLYRARRFLYLYKIIFKTVHYIDKNEGTTMQITRLPSYRRGVFVFKGQSNIVKIVHDNSFVVQGNKNVDERGSTHCN